MAYAALRSLSQTLDQFLTTHDQYPFLPVEREHLDLLKRNVCTLLVFLEEYSLKCSESFNLLKVGITDAAYKAEDIIESHFSFFHPSASKLAMKSSKSFSSVGLHEVLQDIDFILEEVMKIKKGVPEKTESEIVSTIQDLNESNTMIGFDDDFMVIRDRLYLHSPSFHIIPIVGMGGIGKSTLAKRLYEDSIKSQRFDICVWIVVSQDYSLRGILLEILRSNKETQSVESYHKNTTGELVERVHKKLFGRRYLIVADDIWSTKAWDDVNRILPKDTKGSGVLVTTRLLDVANYVGSCSNLPHKMHFLSHEQSWSLLKERVFGNGSCHSQMEHIGKKIARNCRGFPLTVVVVAGLLRSSIVEEYWESISHNICSQEPTIALHCLKILSLSYERLPLYLQPCFLYVTAFPEDYRIDAGRLMKLWMSEGFIKASDSKCLEEVAEEYLDDLVARSLLLVSRKRYNGKIKNVRIHDLLRDLGNSKALEEKFHYHDILQIIEGKERRLSIHTQNTLNRLPQIPNPTTRSLLVFYSDIRSHTSFQNFKLLRTLDALTITLPFVPKDLVHLRYLAFKYNKTEMPTLPKLRNLQTLIIHARRRNVDLSCALCVPSGVLMMLSLTQLIFEGVCYLDLVNITNVGETNLQTLSHATNLMLTKEITKMLANVTKLELYYVKVQRWKLDNIKHLEKLQELKIVFDFAGYSALSYKLTFPWSLKILTLDNLNLDGDAYDLMKEISFLPNIEALTLKELYIWTRYTVECQFPKLKFLELCKVHLTVESLHFPSLEIHAIATRDSNEPWRNRYA